MKRALLLLVLALGCARAEPWPESVVEASATADRMIDEGQPNRARVLLERMIDTVPPGAPDTRRAIVQDARFRLARLALNAHQPVEAARHAQAGLALGGGDTLFVANLLVIHGAAQEALGNRSGAADDYQRALRINEALLHEVTHQ